MFKHERNDLDKKWTWYAFQAANFFIILGVAITWILSISLPDPSVFMVPTIVCNITSILLVAIFIYFENQNITNIYVHINKKWIRFYFASLIAYLCVILTSILCYVFKDKIDLSIMMIIDFCLCCALSLIALGLYRYGRFKMDFEMYKRRRGEIVAQEKKVLAERKSMEKLSMEDYEKIRKESDQDKTSTTKATSNLVDHATKE